MTVLYALKGLDPFSKNHDPHSPKNIKFCAFTQVTSKEWITLTYSSTICCHSWYFCNIIRMDSGYKANFPVWWWWRPKMSWFLQVDADLQPPNIGAVYGQCTSHGCCTSVHSATDVSQFVPESQDGHYRHSYHYFLKIVIGILLMK